jgi:UDP-2-acetamido-2-deoxy-ribo-hexuluronate aminotransferase
MKFFDLSPQKNLKKKILKNFNKILKDGSYILGENVYALERKLKEYTRSKYCLTVSSGTDALLVSLMSLELKKNDEIITTAFSYISTAEVILNVGCKPIFVDVDKETSLINVSEIKKKITSRTKAIIVVSLFGIAQDLQPLKKFLKKKNIPIIEDAAQSFGTKLGKKFSCNLTDIGCTSFFPTKSLGAYGDAGAIFTNNKKIYNNCVSIRQHGQIRKYNSTRLGLSARMDEIQAMIILEKLKIFNSELNLRKKLAERYDHFFKKNKIKHFINFINGKDKNLDRGYSYYSILFKNRDRVISYLKKNNIPTNIYYPIILSKQKTFSKYSKGNFKNAEFLSKHILSIPLHPYMKPSEQDYIFKIFKKFN